ncbi:hypothetical protein HYQ45_015120 [Verticillium longisporum]|uniref:Uncharacterized protein n=1 Tax=Verticillium longisporum TaxID=100787 RepID=A0A0G4L336_VERLO|nr:hypothetical protein HYQ44_017437 [Verticillium longisporum]KAG7119350.1 hypothetical protein HYQ45_015120 [Verticillium longisporum]CRK16338.1 hypothetical protein BN1708_011732 [Verticillium longisporum]
MHFATITTTAMAVFAGLASAGIQARQGPGRPTCNPGQFICGFELRTLGRPDSQLADAIRRKQLEPTQIRLDGLFRCVTPGASAPNGIEYVFGCRNTSGVEKQGQCNPQFSKTPTDPNAYCRNGPPNPAAK